MACPRWVRGCVLGQGSFGKVHLAMKISTGELFAVKSVHCSNPRSLAVTAMRNEISILRNLHSHRIVKFLGSDLNVENGAPVLNLFMEYMAGGSLADLMQKFGGQLDETVVCVYTHGILEGVSYLHSQGIVHCDIKGKNILIGSDGEVKIADFGSARRFLASSTGFQIGGTPFWMAPEVINQAEQGPASDIWSLGCTILELVTGRPPCSVFAGAMQVGTRLDGCPTLPDCLSPNCRDFILKCLQKDPQARWTSNQLLTHPFVSTQQKVGKMSVAGASAPLSPTSVSEFPGGDGDGDCQWDNSKVRSPPVLMTPTSKAKIAERTGSKEVAWIVVRSLGGGDEAGQRQLPLSSFMLATTGEVWGSACDETEENRKEKQGSVSKRRRVRGGVRKTKEGLGLKGANTVVEAAGSRNLGGTEEAH